VALHVLPHPLHFALRLFRPAAPVCARLCHSCMFHMAIAAFRTRLFGEYHARMHAQYDMATALLIILGVPQHTGVHGNIHPHARTSELCAHLRGNLAWLEHTTTQIDMHKEGERDRERERAAYVIKVARVSSEALICLSMFALTSSCHHVHHHLSLQQDSTPQLYVFMIVLIFIIMESDSVFFYATALLPSSSFTIIPHTHTHTHTLPHQSLPQRGDLVAC
jgi:hypothetical protein